MNIRSITYFLNPNQPSRKEAIAKARTFLDAARPAYESAGYPVQTARLATVPFPQLEPNWVPARALGIAQELESRAKEAGYDYISLGPAVPAAPGSFELIPEILAGTQNVFLSGRMASGGEGISLASVKACARIIHQAATISPDGFANLRFAALANVPSGAPFFPAAFHEGERPRFALATEAAGLAVGAFKDAFSLEEARRRLVEAVESHSAELARVGAELENRFDVDFGGIDFSLAPFPDADRSLGTALEGLGLPAVGLHGSLASAAFVADALDRAHFPRTGFSGLMLPVMEDSVLAQRAAEGLLMVDDLLLYSAVCGTGLDTVPLPGDVSIPQLQAILLDLAALAQRLGKSLTARLMPIPGKAAGEETGFDFPYFANSRVLSVRAEPLKGLLDGDETVQLLPRER
jgi:uncharacterized protein (UPF0210 family)